MIHAPIIPISYAAPPHDPLELPRLRRPLPPESGLQAGQTEPAGAQVARSAVAPQMSAFAAMRQRRTRQIAEFGHTPAADLKLRRNVLPDRAIRSLVHALEDMQFQHQDNWRALAQRHLADAGAFVAAAWDYLDNGGGER